MSRTARSREQKRRLEERARARAEAAAVPVPDEADVVVLGGGASGLTAAIATARSDVGVVLLEVAEEAGLPILVTGNGRCNLANVDLSPIHYNAPEFVGHVMGVHPLETVLGLFGGLGLVVEEEEAGRLYPRSRQAASVRNLLVDEGRRLGVVLAPLREVVGVDGNAGQDSRHPWKVRYIDRSRTTRTGTATSNASAERMIRARAVVLATGGGTGALAEGLGIPVVEGRPALCGLACEASPLDRLDGRRVQALVKLERDGREVGRSSGEVLFRKGGLTGPPILDVSRFAESGDALSLDLLPDLSHDEIVAAMARHLDGRGRPTPIALDGLIDPVVGRVIVELADDGWPLPADSVAETAASLAKALPFAVTGRIAAHAQVTQGGIALDRVDTETMAVIQGASGRPIPPGLFATGEVLDVDGPCGGYNLAFAWLSGLKAGRAAAALVRTDAAGSTVVKNRVDREKPPVPPSHPERTARSDPHACGSDAGLPTQPEAPEASAGQTTPSERP